MDPTIIAAIITVIGTPIGTIIAYLILNKLKEGDGKPAQTYTKISRDLGSNRTHILTEETTLNKQFLTGIILVLTCAIIFGGSHVLGKYIIGSTENPLLVITGRNFVSGVVIFLFSLVTKQFSEKKKTTIQFDRDSLLMIIGRTVSGFFYLMTFLYLSATLTITLYKINPIYTFIFLLFLVKTAISKISVFNILIGVIVCIVGSIITINGANIQFGTFSTEWQGIIFVLLAGIFWSVYTVYSEKHSSSHLGQTVLWERQLYLAKIYFISTLPFFLILLIVVYTFPESQFANIFISLIDVLTIVLLGFFSGIIGILYFEALKRISSLLVSVIISLEIFFTMIFETIFLGQPSSGIIFLGAILIIVGAISVGRESDKLKIG
jgi:drug/metabolite transporter (DMT)-like permease